MRSALLAGVVGLALLTAPTGASAAAPPCRRLADGTGDVEVVRINNPSGIPDVVVPDPQDDPVDIVSGDFAGNRDHVAGVIRLVNLVADPTSLRGWSYVVVANIGRTSAGPFVGFVAKLSPLGTEFYAAEFTDPEAASVEPRWTSPAEGSVDHARQEIRIRAPYDAFDQSPVPVTPNSRVRRLVGLSGRLLRPVPVALTEDTARATVSYRLGGPTCVPIGR